MANIGRMRFLWDKIPVNSGKTSKTSQKLLLVDACLVEIFDRFIRTHNATIAKLY